MDGSWIATGVASRFARHWAGRSLLVALLLCLATGGWAQSTAINGTIEGTILDASGGVLPGVTVAVTNVDTGAQRVVTSNERGVYRAPLLSLGTYRLVAELAGFKKFERLGVTLSAGQTAVVNIALAVGEMTETVVVTAETPIVDAGKIDLGRNMGEREVKNLPLVSRNPYNFALLQPGVTGYENPEFGVPRFSANGTLLRINYQVDGNTNTQKDRAGLRLVPMSEVMIKEVKVVTSGYAPEFGQTTGMVYNAITPSGTNVFKGSSSATASGARRFSAFPFFFQGPRTEDRKPDTKINTWTAEVGGPVIRDTDALLRRLREHLPRLVATSGSSRSTRRWLSRSAWTRSPPSCHGRRPGGFVIGKLDFQLNSNHRLSDPLPAVHERLARQRRRQPDGHRDDVRLSRRDELGGGAARLDARATPT